MTAQPTDRRTKQGVKSHSTRIKRSKKKLGNMMVGADFNFLDASSHLFNRMCSLVGRSVGLLVGKAFVRRSTRRTLLAYLALFLYSNLSSTLLPYPLALQHRGKQLHSLPATVSLFLSLYPCLSVFESPPIPCLPVCLSVCLRAFPLF